MEEMMEEMRSRKEIPTGRGEVHTTGEDVDRPA